jgi:hypothetical protein
MGERYPYIRFVVSIAQMLAGTIGVVVLLGGMVTSCRMGGIAGFFQFFVSVAMAGVAYVGAMLWVESLQVFLDIEAHTRRLVDQARAPEGTGAAPSPSA